MPLDRDKKREEFKRLRGMLEKREASRSDAPASSRPIPHRSGSLAHDDLRRIVSRRKTGIPAPDPTSAPDGSPAPIVYSRGMPRDGRSTRVRRRDPDNGSAIPLEDAVCGAEHTCPNSVSCYLVIQPVREEEKGAELDQRFETQVTEPSSELMLRIGKAVELGNLSPEDFVFMDIESTGLSSTPVFLIGVMVWETNGFVVKQYLARHYGEERAILAAFCDLCDTRRILVTFNGKSFDVPFIRTRCAATGTPFSMDLAHLDLLHLSRRVWKGRLPNCKLQTLEWHICGRMRHDDIPGCEIPDAYHAFVRSGNAGQIATILKHNKLDLITLADLMTRFSNEC